MLGGKIQFRNAPSSIRVVYEPRQTCISIARLTLRQVELPPVESCGVLPLLQVGHVRVPPHLLRLHERIQVDGCSGGHWSFGTTLTVAHDFFSVVSSTFQPPSHPDVGRWPQLKRSTLSFAFALFVPPQTPGDSGTLFYDYVTCNMYAILYTALPILLYGTYDRDISAETCLRSVVCFEAIAVPGRSKLRQHFCCGLGCS